MLHLSYSMGENVVNAKLITAYRKTSESKRIENEKLDFPFIGTATDYI